MTKIGPMPARSCVVDLTHAVESKAGVDSAGDRSGSRNESIQYRLYERKVASTDRRNAAPR